MKNIKLLTPLTYLLPIVYLIILPLALAPIGDSFAYAICKFLSSLVYVFFAKFAFYIIKSSKKEFQGKYPISAVIGMIISIMLSINSLVVALYVLIVNCQK